MNWISSEFDLGMSRFMKEKDGAKLVAFGFVAVTVLETGLLTHCKTGTKFTFCQIFGKFVIEITHHFHVSC